MFVREHTRYAVELAVRMKCATWADYLELHTSNLSRGGLFVPSAMSAPIGTAIAIELTLPDGKVIALRGEVAHVSVPPEAGVAGMGVMFAAVSGETLRALDDALAQAKASARKPVAAPEPVAAPKPVAPIKPKAPPPAPVAVAKNPSAPPPPANATADARTPKFADAVEQALLDELARRLELAPHDQLGVALDAGDAAIEEAHGRLRERYAPGIFARYGASTAGVVKSINDAIDAAHARLMNPAERRALVIAAHQPKPQQLTPAALEQKRRGEEARTALRAGIERRVDEACAHRDLGRIDEAIAGFEHVLELDRKHEYARAELAQLRDLKAKRKR